MYGRGYIALSPFTLICRQRAREREAERGRQQMTPRARLAPVVQLPLRGGDEGGGGARSHDAVGRAQVAVAALDENLLWHKLVLLLLVAQPAEPAVAPSVHLADGVHSNAVRLAGSHLGHLRARSLERLHHRRHRLRLVGQLHGPVLAVELVVCTMPQHAVLRVAARQQLASGGHLARRKGARERQRCVARSRGAAAHPCGEFGAGSDGDGAGDDALDGRKRDVCIGASVRLWGRRLAEPRRERAVLLRLVFHAARAQLPALVGAEGHGLARREHNNGVRLSGA